jgi:hypothetical protein
MRLTSNPQLVVANLARSTAVQKDFKFHIVIAGARNITEVQSSPLAQFSPS